MSAALWNSRPLSTTIRPGSPWVSARSSRTRTTAITTGASFQNLGTEATHIEGFEWGNGDPRLFSGETTVSSGELVPPLGDSPIFGYDFELVEVTVFYVWASGNDLIGATVIDPSFVFNTKVVVSASGELIGFGAGAGLSWGFSVSDGSSGQGHIQFSK